MRNIPTKITHKQVADITNIHDLNNKMKSKYKFSGEGCYSTVYKNTDNISVIKVTDDIACTRFIEKLVLKHNNKHFPKIYEIITFSYKKDYVGHAIIMEKLYGPIRRGVRNEITNQIFSTVARHNLYGFPLQSHRKFPQSFRESISLLKNFANTRPYLEEDFEVSRDSFYNIMFRDNNDLVITDPFLTNL